MRASFHVACPPLVPCRIALLATALLCPAVQVGAYYIPLTHLVETAGSRSGLSGERDPSICLLYQGGSCKAQEHCRQIHAEAGFITRMRELHRVNNDCCVKHGDVWSHTSEFNTLLAKYQGAFVISARSARGQMLYVPKAYVAHTAPMVTSLRLLWDSQVDALRPPSPFTMMYRTLWNTVSLVQRIPQMSLKKRGFILKKIPHNGPHSISQK